MGGILFFMPFIYNLQLMFFTKKSFLYITILLLILSECSTTISTQIKRPAQLELEGAGSIAVLPFQEAKRDGDFISILSIILTGKNPNKEKSDTKRIAEHITDTLNTRETESAACKIVFIVNKQKKHYISSRKLLANYL